MKYLIMILLALVLTTQTITAEETKTQEFTDISWSEVSKVEKVKKIIGRITILRMLNVVPAEFWKEFGLDLDKETIDWEKTDGIDLDMVLSAHEEMTNAIETKLNEKGSTLGGEEFLRVLMIIKIVNVLDYHIKGGKLYDEKFEEILDSDLKDRINSRIADLIGDRVSPDDLGNPGDDRDTGAKEFLDMVGGGLGNNPSDSFDPNDPLGSLGSMIGGYTGSNTNLGGIGNDSSGALGAIGIGILIAEGTHFTHGWSQSKGSGLETLEDGFDNMIIGGIINNRLDWGDTRAEKEAATQKQKETDLANQQASDDYLSDLMNDIDRDGIPDATDENPNDGPLGDLDDDGIFNENDRDNTDGPAGDFDGDGIINEADKDMDNDGISNEDEKTNATNPQDSDSDNDGYGDKEEDVNGTDPNDSESKPDPDNNTCDDGRDCGSNDHDANNEEDGEDNTEQTDGNDPDAPWNDPADSGGSAGVPTNKDLENITDNLETSNGTTYIEGDSKITEKELAVAMKRIEVIKEKYGVVCDEASGLGCNGGAGNYNDSALQNGVAVTNPGTKL